jgi:hypothetical protein
MYTPKPHSDSWREALKFISKCPVCSVAYNTEEARLFAENDHASLVHLTCVSCKSFFVTMILSLGQGLSSVGMVTDLNFEDVKKVHRADPITLDEMLAGYTQIENINFITKI